MMRRLGVLLGLVLILTLPARAFGQISYYATVSGTVEDASGALLPGVTVTATNSSTGVVTTMLSNEAGAYNITGLLPGTYKISAELSGFQTRTYANVQLGNAERIRLNFTLAVMAWRISRPHVQKTSNIGLEFHIDAIAGPCE